MLMEQNLPLSSNQEETTAFKISSDKIWNEEHLDYERSIHASINGKKFLIKTNNDIIQLANELQADTVI